MMYNGLRTFTIIIDGVPEKVAVKTQKARDSYARYRAKVRSNKSNRAFMILPYRIIDEHGNDVTPMHERVRQEKMREDQPRDIASNCGIKEAKTGFSSRHYNHIKR